MSILSRFLLVLLHLNLFLCYQQRIFKKNLFEVRSSNLNIDCEDEKIPINFGLGKEKIIYLDQDIVVVHKPSHALSVPAVREADCVAQRIADLLNIPRVDQMIVHRLDYATSGVLLFARNQESLRSLHNQFRRPNLIHKTYLAIVAGTVKENEGEINLPLDKDEARGSPYQKVMIGGKSSLTHWQNKLSVNNRTVLRLFPSTGRTHQLRVHCASIGHPILGDYFYGPKEVFDLSDRLLLHAEYLSFTHPRSKLPMAFKVPILDEWTKYLKSSSS